MFENPKLRGLWMALALLLFGTSLRSASAAEIQDRGAFFSAPAKSEAARIIDDLKRSVKKDLVIETFKEIPEDLKQGVNLEDKAALRRLAEQWAVRQAKSKGVNGVYILLVKSPPHLQVEVGNDTQKMAFTIQDREALVGMMLTKLRARQYDGALVDGVNFVSSTMRAHAVGGSHTGLRTDRTRPGNHGLAGWIGPILVGLLVAWVVIAIIRAISGRSGGAGGSAATSAPTAGGGGFFSSLLGGMFGAAAGMWLYDQFSGGHGSTSFGSERENIDPGDSGFSGQDTDYSGSGDSFGDDSGGSDSGGDFGGGNDGGGGDSGGGGDF